MAFVAGLLAHHIRGLGFGAIACGNDTACSIPIAIDAGLRVVNNTLAENFTRPEEANKAQALVKKLRLFT